MLGAIRGLFAGDGLPYDTSIRDRLMADTLLWHLDRLAPDERVVLVAHDLHLQRTAVVEDGSSALVMGAHLAEALGDDYRAIALVHTAPRAPEIVMTDRDPHGFVVVDGAVAEPPATGVEGALHAAGLADVVSFLPLDPLRADPDTRPDHLGAQGVHVPTDVTAAFDAVLTVPTATTSEHVSLY